MDKKLNFSFDLKLDNIEKLQEVFRKFPHRCVLHINCILHSFNKDQKLSETFVRTWKNTGNIAKCVDENVICLSIF